MEIDRASSSSTLMRRRSRQRSPRRTKGIMCQSMRAIRNGGGRNRVQAALHTTLVTSFSSNSRFSARVLWAGSDVVRSASCQEKCRISFSTAWRVPIVVQDDAAGSLVDGDLPAPGFSLNPCLQQICLSECHLFLPQPESDAPPAFVQYGCVHRFLLHEKREPLAAPSDCRKTSLKMSVTEQRGKCEGGKKPPSRSIDTYF